MAINFNSENRYDTFLDGFVYHNVTYCFFLISERPLPKSILVYEQVVRNSRLFAMAIRQLVITLGGTLRARDIAHDALCMKHADGCQGFQVIAVCEQLYHIFIAI